MLINSYFCSLELKQKKPTKNLNGTQYQTGVATDQVQEILIMKEKDLLYRGKCYWIKHHKWRS
jgi:hypothetical protein